jgi:hypothetical protein
MYIRIDDETGKFNQGNYDELVNFITQQLLSDELDISLLDVIRIRNDGPTNYFGYWKATFHYDPSDPTRIVAMAAVIVLNHFYLKTVDSLMKTLAHEYGHHWTLSYLAINQGIDMRQRLPIEYYQLRLLNPDLYAHDYSMGWNRCDREIIAEDYRVLFAPSPHNQDHKMAADSDSDLSLPALSVKNYIMRLERNGTDSGIT